MMLFRPLTIPMNSRATPTNLKASSHASAAWTRARSPSKAEPAGAASIAVMGLLKTEEAVPATARETMKPTMMVNMPSIMNRRMANMDRGRPGTGWRAELGTECMTSSPSFCSRRAITPRAMVIPPRIMATPRNLK